MPAGFRAEVPPIAGQPSPYGLLGGCVEVVTTNDLHQLNGTDMLPVSCADSNLWYQCDGQQAPTTPTNPASKTFDRPGTCTFEPVTVYKGVECSTFGLSYDEMQARALEGLQLGEQRALEEDVMRRQLCAMATGNDLTPVTGPLHIAQGVGALESWLATNYGGAGVLHVPAGAAGLLAMHRLAELNDEGHPETLMGNCVILGAGYAVNVGPATPPATGCTTAPAGEAWLYITPPVRVRRDAPFLADVVGQGINTRTNDRRALAETTFVTEFACCTAAAVRVSLAACP